ncbi:unnamed protein product [Vicia faba]|uniref:Uncharacterized protein n=1 Tax=Vicia faba TaxID=3906 RepID=A0AAV0ZI49_VICFA|nr:unnamed protein product [Vicia faba]
MIIMNQKKKKHKCIRRRRVAGTTPVEAQLIEFIEGNVLKRYQCMVGCYIDGCGCQCMMAWIGSNVNQIVLDNGGIGPIWHGFRSDIGTTCIEYVVQHQPNAGGNDGSRVLEMIQRNHSPIFKRRYDHDGA